MAGLDGCVPLHGARCLPPPPVFDLPPPPDPSLIWQLINEDAEESLESLQRIRSRSCESAVQNPLLELIGLTREAADGVWTSLVAGGDVAYIAVSALFVLFFIACTTTVCVMRVRRRRRHKQKHGPLSSLNSSGGESRLSAETVATVNVAANSNATWLFHKNTSPQPTHSTATTMVVQTKDGARRYGSSQSSTNIHYLSSARALPGISMDRGPGRIVNSSTFSRRRAAPLPFAHSPTVSIGFSDQNQGQCRSASIRRLPAQSPVSPFYWPAHGYVYADGSGSGSRHYEECIPEADGDALAVAPYQMRMRKHFHQRQARTSPALHRASASASISPPSFYADVEGFESAEGHHRLALDHSGTIPRKPPPASRPPPPPPEDAIATDGTLLYPYVSAADCSFTLDDSASQSNSSADAELERLAKCPNSKLSPRQGLERQTSSSELPSANVAATVATTVVNGRESGYGTGKSLTQQQQNHRRHPSQQQHFWHSPSPRTVVGNGTPQPTQRQTMTYV